ncbi:MAG: hypothetical protein GY861_13825 [bacterium]|nr:hypothetical protein [bacterium]
MAENSAHHYAEAKTYLNRMNSALDNREKAIAEITLKKEQLASTRARITLEYDARDDISKTALKARVDGNSEVLEANKAVEREKANKEVSTLKYEHLDKYYSLEKKRIDSLTQELKFLPGGIK